MTSRTLLVLSAFACGCSEDPIASADGGLRVIVVNAGDAATVDVHAERAAGELSARRPLTPPETIVDFAVVRPGTWECRVVTRDAGGRAQRAVWIAQVLIQARRVTELIVDMAGGAPADELCDGRDDDGDGLVDEDAAVPLCAACVAGELAALADDARCGALSCAAWDYFTLRVSPADATSTCVHVEHDDVSERCEERGRCALADAEHCPGRESVVASAGACEVILGCESGAPTIDRSACVPMPEVCNGADDDADLAVDEELELALCTACVEGALAAAPDDPRCGVIDCDLLDRVELRGDNTAAGTSACVRVEYDDLADARCAGAGACVEANGPACTGTDVVLATAGLCRVITDCASGTPAVEIVTDGTPCGTELACWGGACVDPGCADGTREGFTDAALYPDIAACAGGWSVPGVTRADLAAECAHQSGNDLAGGGAGCSAADLCAPGWHVCAGRGEVEALAGSCADAVPAGAPPRFFAVTEHSTADIACDDSSGDNDVFGCGTLGHPLAADCAPLDRALASTAADSCGVAGAEPPDGPWRCLGGATSHLHEGALVTKDGCDDGACGSTGNSDAGGVLCCRD